MQIFVILLVTGATCLDLSPRSSETSDEGCHNCAVQKEYLWNDLLACQLKAQSSGQGTAYVGPAVDCGDVLARSPHAKSGVYTVYTGLQQIATRVYCDMKTLRGGWTSILRRFDGSVDFNRPWAEVKNQIGDLEAEHWLGLDAIYRLTNEGLGNYELLVELEDDQFAQYARYSSFWIEDEPHKYRLHVSGYNPRSTAGNSLSYHNNKRFSTMDNDNDEHAASCAETYKGAWWYSTCHRSNLLAAYLYTPENRGATSKKAQGVNWYHFTGLHKPHLRSLKKASMKIRRTTN